MAEVSSSAAKVCAACAKDVTNLPRTKDAQGRYFCKDCLAKLKTKANQAAKPAEQDAVMSKLLSDSPSVELCPNCGGGIQSNAKICIRCGYNKETGKAMRVQVERAKQDKEPKSGGSGISFGMSPGLYLLLLVLVVGGGFGAAMFNPMFAILLYALASLLGLVATIWAIVAAFKDGDGVYGILGIVGFVIPFCGLAILYYALVKTGREYLKMTYAAALIGAVLAVIGILGGIPEGESDLTPKTQQRSSPGNRAPANETPQNTPPAEGSPLGG